jgi:hypothetical protein
LFNQCPARAGRCVRADETAPAACRLPNFFTRPPATAQVDFINLYAHTNAQLLTMRKKNKAGERLLILTCWISMMISGAAWLLLKNVPALRTGVTLTLFGCSFLAVACMEMRVKIAASEQGAVYRADNVGRYRILVTGKIVTGIIFIGFAWYV